MTSADESVIAGLDPRTCAPDVLAALAGQGDARLRTLGLARLADRLDERPEDGDRYAASLPASLEDLVGAVLADGPPEAALALARVHLRLRAHVRAWPGWREAGLPVRVQIAWLCAEIAGRPAAVRDEPAGDLLYRAVRGLAVVDLDDPEAFAWELMERPDPVLRAEAFRIVRDALLAAVLVPRRARALVESLAADVPAALAELAEPWAALDPLPEERMRRFLAAGPAGPAIEAAARHGHRRLLRDVAADPGRPPRLRRRSLELLGGMATREDVGDLTGIAVQDPLLLAGPAVACLSGMHRRGHFPSGRDVPAIVGLALADHCVPAGEVAALLFSCRHETLRELTTAAEPTCWPRRLELLVALDAQGVPGLDVGGAVTALARRADDPAPFLRAIRELRHLPAEDTVLDLLPRAPREALAALEAVGGERTAGVLRDGLGLDGGGIVRHLRPFRHRALELLWHLTGDTARRRSLLERLNPRDLPRRIADDLGAPDPRELALLRAGLDPQEPVEALARLARNGDASTVPALADLLLRVASAGDEASVPDEAVAAVRDLGARLFRRGAIRPRCLLDAADAAGAGHALVASLALDLLDRPGLVPSERTALLDLLRRTPYRRAKARVHPLLRHRDRHVRGHAIAVIARDAGDARAMSASLIPLTRADDEQTVRQALLALGEARATWAAPAVAACLDHRNMNVKKTAATALTRAGAPSAVPKLLYWLGHHDNPGFRDALTDALRTILAGAFAATVLAAADRAEDDRARALLLSALDGLLSPRSAAALARYGVTVPVTTVSDARSLLEHGWNTEIARRVVDEHERDPARPPDRRLRPQLPRWLDLAASGDPGPVLRFTLRLCPPPWADAELETAARSSRTLVDGLAAIGDARLLDLLDKAIPKLRPLERLDLTGQVRGLALGRAGLVLLRRCGAVLTRDDLHHALATAENQEAVLREAFAQAETDGALHESFHKAAQDPDSLARLRAQQAGTSRDRLDALIAAYPMAPASARAALLDWMLDLQPLDAPPWTLAEEARTP
ncbi:HEAT repeat domain-containing protein, partial [Actinomadura rubrisoli]